MDQDIERDITDASGFETEDGGNAIIKVIGVGGGGGNAVNYMYQQNIPLIKYVVCNTDKQALEMSPVGNKLLIGRGVTNGRGAGNKPEVGRECAEESIEDIRALFRDETEMVFITAGWAACSPSASSPCPSCSRARRRSSRLWPEPRR